MQSKKTKPAFYQDFYLGNLLDQVESPTQYFESTKFWMFRHKDWIYKTRRDFNERQGSFEMLMAQDLVHLTNLHSPFWEMSLLTLCAVNSGWVLQPLQKELPPGLRHFVFRMRYLLPSANLGYVIDKKKFKPQLLGTLAEFLVQLHQNTNKLKKNNVQTQDHWEKQIADLLYQSKKYLGKTVTQATLDMVEFPLFKFTQTHKKLLQKRLNHNTCQVHGSFILPKIFLYQNQISVLPHNFKLFKDQFQDVAADVADLALELRTQLDDNLANGWIQAYADTAQDPDLLVIIAFHQVLKALKHGILESVEGLSAIDKQQTELHFSRAKGYYAVATNLSQDL